MATYVESWVNPVRVRMANAVELSGIFGCERGLKRLSVFKGQKGLEQKVCVAHLQLRIECFKVAFGLTRFDVFPSTKMSVVVWETG